MKDRLPVVLAAAILGVAFIVAVTIFSTTWRKARLADQTITVTGSAKKDIVSDLAFLRGMLSVQSTSAEEAYRTLQSQKPEIIAYLERNGFPREKIQFFTTNNYPIYETTMDGRQTGAIRAYNYNQRLEIQSTDVKKIQALSLDISSLIEKGVNFQVDPPEYHYTKLADMKIEIQAEAAKDAMTRASKIASATDRELGPLRTARMGVLQITPRLSNVVSDYGMNDLSSIEKEITAVVNASFAIE